MTDRNSLHIAEDILRLRKMCYKNGNLVDGKLWDHGNGLIRERYGLDIDEWSRIRKEFVEPILKELEK